MNIRLLLPICTKTQGLLCKESWFYQERLDLLNIAFNQPFFTNPKNNIDIVITSNNFFCFSASCLAESDFYINEFLIPRLNDLSNKKTLIIGIDLYNERISFNPYRGIPSLVAALYSKNNKFFLQQAIWECWNGCDRFCFQNQNRILRYNQIEILLSCGDILFGCNKKLSYLNLSTKVDIIIDLAHLNISKNLYRVWGKITQKVEQLSDILIITQQLTKSSTLIQNNNYKLLWYNHLSKLLRQNIIKGANYYLIDIII